MKKTIHRSNLFEIFVENVTSEAVALTFFGGIAGIFLGWLASLLVTQLVGLATVISLSSIFLAFGVSAGVGIVFGFYPARRAANSSPMEALRYE